MASNLTKVTVGTTVAVAAGVAVGRKLDAMRSGLLDKWTTAGDPAHHDILEFPEGDEFHITTADGTELAAIDVPGTGAAVLLIHGYTGTRGHWGPVALRLAEAGHRVIAYDQRGHGGSGVGADGFTMSALGNDLRAVLERLDLRDVTVAGHSMGGIALSDYLGAHPDSARNRVRLGVLTSTAARSSEQPAIIAALAPRVLGSSGFEKVMADPRKGAFGLRTIVGTEVRMNHLDGARRTMLETPLSTRTGVLDMLRSFDGRDLLARIETPVVIAIGTHDQVTPIDLSRELDELVAHASLHVFPGAGHMLPWERTGELTDLILRASDRAATTTVRSAPAGG